MRSRFLLLAGVLLVAGPQARAEEPPAPAELESSIQRGVDFLVKIQNKDGSWGTAQHTKNLNVHAPVPGGHQAYRAAVTALCVASLIESSSTNHNKQTSRAVVRGEEWLLTNLPNLRRSDPNTVFNVWGHAYGIQALVDMARRETGNAKRLEQIRSVIRTQVYLLRRFESVNGGWGYLDMEIGAQRPASPSLPFCTAAVLVALHQAKQMGIEVPDEIVRPAISSIQRQRKPDHTYLYGEFTQYQPMRYVNRAPASLGRSQVCNMALRLWGDKTITDEIITGWLDRLVARNGWLSIGRKRPVPHESWFQVAGYFYYFGHYYAALCVEQLNTELAPKYRDSLAAILVPLQEADGSWWDYPMYNYHQQYGTAFALMSLARCRKTADLNK